MTVFRAGSTCTICSPGRRFRATFLRSTGYFAQDVAHQRIGPDRRMLAHINFPLRTGLPRLRPARRGYHYTRRIPGDRTFRMKVAGAKATGSPAAFRISVDPTAIVFPIRITEPRAVITPSVTGLQQIDLRTPPSSSGR